METKDIEAIERGRQNIFQRQLKQRSGEIHSLKGQLQEAEIKLRLIRVTCFILFILLIVEF